MAIDIEDKTEQPTERRRRLAREEGLGPRSAAFTVSCRLLGVAIALQLFGSRLVQDCARVMTESLQKPLAVQLTVSLITSRGWDAVVHIGGSALGCGACVLVAGLAAQWFQVGFRFQTAELLPDASRLSPSRGLSKLWNFDNLVQAVLALIKYLAVLAFGGWYIWSSLGRAVSLADSDVGTIAQMIGSSTVTLAWQLAGLFLIFGLADYGYQFWKFEQSLKMTPAEIREEIRQQSGDPRWKQQRRELWQQQLVAARPVDQAPVQRK